MRIAGGAAFFSGAALVALAALPLASSAQTTLRLISGWGANNPNVPLVEAVFIKNVTEASKGQIRIDGVAIEEYKLDALRRQTGVVLQDVFLFSGSVLDNITLRNPEISRAQVEHAAQLIGMHQFIEQLPGGYDYNVMERGSTLSLGQRQLLSFIRALLYDPSILILDEATSSVDTESEQLIQHAIDTLVKGRTSIIVAHRLSTIQHADMILVFDHGEIIESGTHNELITKNGHYKKLYEMQFAEEEILSVK